jgi:hypothetical protein
MATAATISARLILDSSDYNKGIDDASKKSGTFSNDFASKMSSVGSKMALAGGVMSATVTTPIVMGFKSAIEASSNLAESTNAMNVVFEDSSDIISKFGENSATAVGLSESSFNQMAATTGAMLTNYGLDQNKAANETINLTKRAADMASIFNTDVSDAMTAVQAGLRGETEPLRRYGVSMDAASIKAKMLAMGLSDATPELEKQSKATAALAIFYEQTDQFAGDFANTSDGLANSQRILNAELEDASAKLGDEFRPILLDLVKIGREVIKWFSDLSPEMKKTIGIIALIIAVVGPLLLVIGSIISAIGFIIPLIGAISIPVLIVIGVIAALIAIGVLLYFAWTQNWGGIQEKTKAVVDWIKTAIPEFLDKIKNYWDEHGGALKRIVDGIWTWIQDSFETFKKIFKDLFDAFSLAFQGDWYGFGEKIRDAWDEWLTYLGDSVKGAWDTLKDSFMILWDNIVKFFTETDWGKIGHDIITGIAEGLKRSDKILADAASAAAKAAYDATRGFFGIHSPSKLFADIGKNLMLGEAEGINNYKNIPTSMTLKASSETSSIIPTSSDGGSSQSNQNTLLELIASLLEDQPDKIARAVRAATAKVR